ncbi:MAG: transglycosylase SLT domain-containing protein [Candidatus Firestonebacteria bacterium]|nr:transglycosylase SLT domain-containing protein [Candidatus Firestonebacteria bacterium]
MKILRKKIKRLLAVALCLGLGCLPVYAAANTETAVTAEDNTRLAEAQSSLMDALDQYNQGDFLSAEVSTHAAGVLLYDPLFFPKGDEVKRSAELASTLSLLTVRINRFLHEVKPELEPERFSLAVPFNPRIEGEIDRFLTGGREEFARWLRRSGRYLEKMRETFRREDLPEDLVYLALVESGFNPRNRSSKQAVGLFQFMLGTAEMVGLKSDLWKDERRDPDKAALAAIRHLKSLYQEFGDWDLALAAYNAGSGRVWQSIKSQGVRDYWQLALPPETEAYVPRFYAALVISREPELYGFSPVLDAKVDAEEIEVPGGVDLKVVAACAGVTPSAIAELNVELTKNCTPPGTDPYTLRLPPGTGARFQTAFAALTPAAKFLSAEEIARRRFKGVYMVYTVKGGDSLYTIARKFHTTVPKITQGNPLMRNRRYIHPGEKLRIYRVQ